MSEQDKIKSDQTFDFERIQLTKKLIDDLTFTDYYKRAFIKSERERITVFLQAHTPFLNDVLNRSTLAVSLQHDLFLKYELTLSDVAEVLPLNTDLFLGNSMVRNRVQGVVVPMIGVSLKREADVFLTITSLISFQHHIMSILEKHYLPVADCE